MDDDPIIRAVLDSFLESKGFNTRRARNGREALEVLATTPFDAVLTDLLMPGMDGASLVDRLSKDHPCMALVVVTGLRAKEYQGLIPPGRVDEVIEKPILDLSLVSEALESAMGNRRQRPRSSQPTDRTPA